MQTSRYIVKRILLALVSLFAIITITYFLMNLMPGDPFMSEKASEENRAILEAMEEIRKIYVHPEIKKYLVDIAEASRQDGELLSGVSPRGTLALFKGIRAYAWLKGRDYVVPEDVKALAVPVLAHRLVLAGAGDTDAERRVMEEILKRVEVPVEDWKKK